MFLLLFFAPTVVTIVIVLVVVRVNSGGDDVIVGKCYCGYYCSAAVDIVNASTNINTIKTGYISYDN